MVGGRPGGRGVHVDRDGGAGVLRTIVTEVGSDLAGGLAPLSEASFDDAVRVLTKARRILVVANGGSSMAATAFAVRFRLRGRAAEAPADTVVQALTAHARSSLAEPADTVLIVGSGSGPYAAHGVSATIIQLTFLLGLRVAVSEEDGASRASTDRDVKHLVALINPKLEPPDTTDLDQPRNAHDSLDEHSVLVHLRLADYGPD